YSVKARSVAPFLCGCGCIRFISLGQREGDCFDMIDQRKNTDDHDNFMLEFRAVVEHALL
ncbi:hypothetical protein JV197_17990, partial [Vibrio furnissii]